MRTANQENIKPLPRTPQKGSKRIALGSLTLAAPKRATRTYQQQARASSSSIPFAPRTSCNIESSLLDQLESLNVGLETRERIIGMHQKMLTLPSRPAKRSFFARSSAWSKRPQPITPPALLQRIRQPVDRIPLDSMRQLRVALATESPAWLDEFLDASGYDTLLAHLDSLLRMEWREEQHDDTLLYEILRCIVALGSSKSGRSALIDQAPAPFEQLCVALYSDQIPKELETRRMIFLLLHMLVGHDLPPTVLEKRSVHQVPVQDVPCLSFASKKHDGAELAAMLLHTPRPSTMENKVDFLQCAHEHRPLRKHVEELQRVCGEFFWIFCHENNAIWDWDSLDTQAAMAPRVPSGMTGSVEWEAIMYLTENLSLINAILASFLKSSAEAARAFVDELYFAQFSSVIQTLRLASQSYYTSMHAELAHWCALERQSKQEALPFSPIPCSSAEPELVPTPLPVSTSTPASGPKPGPTSMPPMIQVEESALEAATSPALVATPYFTPMLPSEPIRPHRTVSHIRHVSTERVSIPVSPRTNFSTITNKHTGPDSGHRVVASSANNTLDDIDIANIGF